jgi:hypothetical protein
MRWRISRHTVAAGLALAACGGSEQPGTRFEHVTAGAPGPVMILRDDSSRTAEGHRVAELDVLMAGVTDEAAARATLQRIIDSVAAADTLAAAVRVTGFIMGEVDRETSSADLVPAMRATWGPLDAAGYVGRERRSRYRTHFVVLHAFDAPVPAGRRP